MARKTDWEGVFVVNVTPFTEAGDLDEASFKRLMQFYVADGVQGVVVAGSTGEWYTMSDEERIRVFELARAALPRSVKLIAGTSAIGTRETVKLTAAAKRLGCDGAMVLAPPYALPNERELMTHFEAVNEVGLPLMIYNNPGRTQITFTTAQVVHLAGLQSVVALKESSKDLYAISSVLRAVSDKIAVFSGLEPYARATIDRGGVGIVSMCANFMGREAVEFYRLAKDGPREAAIRRENAVDRLYEAFYLGGHGAYVTIKECMRLVGRPAGWPRRPHLRMPAPDRAKLAAILKEVGLPVVAEAAE